MMTTIPSRIQRLIDRYGSLRAAARVLRIDAGYLLRLKTCEKYNPGKAILRKLGLLKVVSIHYVTKEH